jgi:hypothetical protein
MSDDMNVSPEQPVEPVVSESAPTAEPVALEPLAAAPAAPPVEAVAAPVAAAPTKPHRWLPWAAAAFGVLVVLVIGSRLAFGMHRAFTARGFRAGYAASQVQRGGYGHGYERGFRNGSRGFGRGRV